MSRPTAGERPGSARPCSRRKRELAEANLSVIVIVAGVGGAGKAETVDLLLEWLDGAASRPTP